MTSLQRTAAGISSFLAVVAGSIYGRDGQAAPSALDSLPTSESLRGTAGLVLHRLEIVDPGSRAGSARLLVRFMDDDADARGGPGTIAVSIGKKVTLVPAVRRPGKAFTVPASNVDIQHWRLDDKDILVYVRPNDEITFLADACAIWTLSSARLNPNVGSPDVACQIAKAPCSSGWRGLTDRPAEGDDRCPSGESQEATKFCARTGTVSVKAYTDTQIDLGVVGADDKSVQKVGPRTAAEFGALFERCSIPTLTVAGHTTLLVIGFGERWSLLLGSGGRLSGSASLAAGARSKVD